MRTQMPDAAAVEKADGLGLRHPQQSRNQFIRTEFQLSHAAILARERVLHRATQFA